LSKVILASVLWAFFYISSAAAMFITDCGAPTPLQTIVSCSDFIGKEPTFAPAYVTRATAYLAVGDEDHALDDLNSAVALSATFARAYSGRGYRAYGDADHPIIPIFALGFAQSTLADALYHRGLFHNNKGDHLDAVRDFSETIKLNLQDAQAYQNRGVTLQAMGRDVEAEFDFAKAKELSAR
jgi:tetratricopeptide (TPR) repeat protein